MLFRRTIYIILITLFIISFAEAQHKPSTERGDPISRAKQQMEGNQVRTTIFNFGQTGREGGQFPITEQTPYEWPKNTGKVYLALTGLLVGGEVFDNNNVRQRIVNIMNYRRSPQGESWNFEPLPGYFNSSRQEIATSVDEDTWPVFWPDKLSDSLDPGWRGSWNGYFGKNIFNADQEIFYRASDDRYSRYADYYPDETDLTRKGLGIIFDSRTLAWSQILVQDVVFLLHTIKNDGTRDIPKVAVTIWYADFVGGDGDSQDDISEYSIIHDIAWSRDRDNRAPTFGNDPVGIVAVTFLETPGNALDRIDNDGDSPELGPIVSIEMLDGEIPDNGIDDNGNGLIDENMTHVPFGTQVGVVYADGIAQPLDPQWLIGKHSFKVEANSPVVTQEMVNQASSYPGNRWLLWPPPDEFQNGVVHLIMVTEDKIGLPFKDNIDNDGDGEEGSPVITQEIIDLAANDPYKRYRVNDRIILYNVTQSTLGMKYADGIDNDGNGAVDEGIDDGIDVMIDERRDDGIDNDYDWNPLTDDVGLDGVPGTGDFGENDGKPTSGAGTGLPGEPNIDVTDVSETDQIGITGAAYIAAGSVDVNTTPDAYFWNSFMIPGKFFDPALVVAGEYDLWVSSSYFPLRAGQTEPISLAVILANAPIPDPDGEMRKQEVLKKRVRAQETYNNDYQFANAPITPTVTAIPGDNRVTLYWDDAAEFSFDSYIAGIGGDGNDFEGYRIYRSTDPAFEDIENITNAYGIKTFKTPLAIFDLKNGIFGLDSIGFDGVKYNLGTDSGLQHSFVDSTVQNGFTYYYAVVSYDRGFPSGNIIPSESPIRVSLRGDGSVSLGRNVVRVIPEAPAAGYVPPTLGEINHVQGTTTGLITYDIIDINRIRDGHVYYVTFEDTLKRGTATTPDTLTTKNFTLTDSTAGVVLINKSTQFASDFEQPIIDGFKLILYNESIVELDKARSVWNNPDELPAFIFERFSSGSERGDQRPNDYIIVFGDLGIASSTEFRIGNNLFPSIPVNFNVFNQSSQSFIPFGFVEVDTTGGPGLLTVRGTQRDRIVFLEPNAQDSLVKTWWFYLPSNTDIAPGVRFPSAADTAYIFLKKPFLSTDVFRFVAKAGSIDLALAKEQLERIKVVPNPYIATALWEQKNPYASGRGPRSLHFTHLPNKCTIRIFTVNGELVKTIEHESAFNDGTAYWDMLTRDNLSISYGVYIFHVDAPGIGEKIGKFAVIK